MKYVFVIIVIVGIGFIGYFIEPSFRKTLTGLEFPKTPEVEVSVVAVPDESVIAPEPAVEVEVKSEPEPVVEVELELQVVEVDLVNVMKNSLGGGALENVEVDDVIQWQALKETENFEGETYQVGVVVYTSDSLFGVRKIKAKALIKGEKVVRWYWPDNGLDLK